MYMFCFEFLYGCICHIIKWQVHILSLLNTFLNHKKIDRGEERETLYIEDI
jgi:hypothetical protein